MSGDGLRSDRRQDWSCILHHCELTLSRGDIVECQQIDEVIFKWDVKVEAVWNVIHLVVSSFSVLHCGYAFEQRHFLLVEFAFLECLVYAVCIRVDVCSILGRSVDNWLACLLFVKLNLAFNYGLVAFLFVTQQSAMRWANHEVWISLRHSIH